MIISFISHYIRKANVTHAGAISGSEPGYGAEKEPGWAAGGRGRLRRRLGERPRLWGGGKWGRSCLEEGGPARFLLSGPSSVKRGGGVLSPPPTPGTHTALALARPAQGLVPRLLVAPRRGCWVQRAEGCKQHPSLQDPLSLSAASKEEEIEPKVGRQQGMKSVSFRFPAPKQRQARERGIEKPLHVPQAAPQHALCPACT